MKNIFKKNQIIITALAIMIAIAGYLNLSDTGDKAALETNSGEVLDYNTAEETMGDDITQSDVFSDDVLLDDTVLDLSDSDDADTLTASDDKTTDTAKKDGKAEEVATLDVSDTGEVKNNDEKDTEQKDTETSAPGEAVLVSTTTTADFFATNRLSREQTRAVNKEDLRAIIDSDNLTEAAKEEAVSKLISLTSIAEKENATETLLEAKGFSDALVTITEDNVDVVVNTLSLTEQEVAQITDIVTRKTGMDVKDIVIAPVVATD